MTERKQRVPFRDFSTLSAEDREMGERAQVNGKVINIFRVLMNHPKLARAWSKWGDFSPSCQVQRCISAPSGCGSKYCRSLYP